MMLDDVIEIRKPDPDSQYRLLPCKCKSDNVAYILGVDGNWRGHCFDCGRTGEGSQVRHEAQKMWNEVGRHGKI
jgi:hypothetical protein